MCQRRTCPTCQKPGFIGCGEHIEEVLGDVPPEDRCKCEAAPKASGFLSRFMRS